MIITEHYKTSVDGVDLFRTYSNEGLLIRKYIIDEMGNGIEMDEVCVEAIDFAGAPYAYEEYTEPIDGEEN